MTQDPTKWRDRACAFTYGATLAAFCIAGGVAFVAAGVAVCAATVGVAVGTFMSVYNTIGVAGGVLLGAVAGPLTTFGIVALGLSVSLSARSAIPAAAEKIITRLPKPRKERNVAENLGFWVGGAALACGANMLVDKCLDQLAPTPVAPKSAFNVNKANDNLVSAQIQYVHDNGLRSQSPRHAL